MEQILGLGFVVALIAFVLVGLAIGSSAEGAAPATPIRAPRELRATRAGLLVTAAVLAVLGAEAGLVTAAFDDAAPGRAQALVFLLEALVDLVLAVVVLRPTWTLRVFWVLRMVAVCWLVVGPPALILTFGRGPAASFYLGVGPGSWAAFALLAGVALVWLASLGGVSAEDRVELTEAAEPESASAADAAVSPAEPLMPAEPSMPAKPEAPGASAPATRLGRVSTTPTHWRGILTGAVLASMVAISAWPMAQFAGVVNLGGCTPQWLVPSDPSFCVNGHLDGRNLTVSGDTNLPDGTLVDVEASGVSAGVGSGNAPHQRIPVQGGKFQATFFISSQSVNSVVATATLSMDGQLPVVLERYGADGHDLFGPAAGKHCGQVGGRCVIVSLTFPFTP